MSVESDFEDTVRICEFYADSCESFEVDLENCFVSMGTREGEWTSGVLPCS